MQKVNISYVGLSAAASSALVQSVVEQLGPEGVVAIYRDDNGASITLIDEGERFKLPNGDALTFEGGVPTFECNFTGDLRTDFDELAREWEGKDMADAADLPDLNLRSWEPRKAFDGIGEAVKGLRIEEPIGSLKPRIRAGASKNPVSDHSNEAWLIELSGNRFVFNRLIGGEINESYRPMETDEALLAAVSVIQGFQPPRRLYRLDKPAG